MSKNNVDLQDRGEVMLEQMKENEEIKPLDSTLSDELILNRDYDKLIQVAQENNSLKVYPKMKYQNKFYKVGENVILIQAKSILKVEQVGKIKRILSVLTNIDQIEIPLIQVNWYCDRREISHQYNDYQSCFSMNELFLTELENVVYVDSIVGHCTVLNFETYEKNIESQEDRLFFTRASYNTKTQKMHPLPSEWQKICICNMPTNPELAYIFCDICLKWLHMSCVKITDEQASKIDKYTCPKCKKK